LRAGRVISLALASPSEFLIAAYTSTETTPRVARAANCAAAAPDDSVDAASGTVKDSQVRPGAVTFAFMP